MYNTKGIIICKTAALSSTEVLGINFSHMLERLSEFLLHFGEL